MFWNIFLFILRLVRVLGQDLGGPMPLQMALNHLYPPVFHEKLGHLFPLTIILPVFLEISSLPYLMYFHCVFVFMIFLFFTKSTSCFDLRQENSICIFCFFFPSILRRKRSPKQFVVIPDLKQSCTFKLCTQIWNSSKFLFEFLNEFKY